MKSKKRLKSKITKLLLVIPLVALMLLILNVSGALAYFTDRISLTNIFTVKDSHTVTYRYYEIDENNNITTLQASKSKVYFDGSTITLGEDSEYFINNSNKYESVTYKIGSAQIQNTYTTTNSNVTIDQYYQLKRYTVSYNLDGGTVETANPTVYTEKTETFTLNNPTKTGYTFAGWNGKNLYNYNENSNKDSRVTISADNNGYVSSNTPETDKRVWIYNNCDFKTTLPAGTYSLTILFSTVPNNNGAQEYSGVAVIDTDDNHLYTSGLCGELYNKSEFTVAFTLAEEKNIGIMIKAYDGVYRVQLEEGSNATEWEPYAENPVTIAKGSTGDRSYKAVWSINSYTLTVNPSGGTWNSSTSNSEITQNYNTTLNIPVPTRVGYTFNGWTKAGSGSITSNTPVATTTQVYTYGAGNATLTANWTANTYTVTADANGGTIPTTTGWNGTGNTSTKQVTYDSAYGALPTPTRTGYTFAGWNGKNLFSLKNGNSRVYNGVTGEISNDRILAYGTNTSNSPYGLLYQFGVENGRIKEKIRQGESYTVSTTGQFKDKIYIQINYKDSNGLERGLFTLNSYNNESQKSFVVPDDYSSLYYFFVGVGAGATEINADFSVQIEEGNVATTWEPYYVESSTNVTQAKNHTLTANWNINSYKLTVNPNGGVWNNSSSNSEITQNYNTTLEIPVPTRKGYKFIGWTKAGSGSITSNTPIATNTQVYTYGAGNATLTANWQEMTAAEKVAAYPEDYYGANISNYSAYGVNSWRIFHSDGDNIYLIATDFLAESKVPASKNGTALGVGTNSSYPNGVNLTNAVNDSNYSSASNAIASGNPARKWLTYLDDENITPSTSNDNMKAVAYLMDQDVWNTFTNDLYADWSIGGPTLELFRDSYNNYPSHSEKTIDTQVASATGYQLKWNSDSSYSNSISGLNTTEVSNLWVKGADSGSAFGYWLASPSASYADCLVDVYSTGTVAFYRYSINVYGLRPVVCLKSTTNIVDNGDGSIALSNSATNPGITTTMTKTANTSAGTVTVNITSSSTDLRRLIGWTLSSDKKSLTKEYTANASESITVYDNYGNSSTQTVNITEIPVYTITLNNQSATTAGTNLVYEKYNFGIYEDSLCTTSINKIITPIKPGYLFEGYYTGTNGAGDQLIDKDGNITSSFTTTKFSSNTTLYAKWREATTGAEFVKSDPATYYGLNITNYTANGVSDWRIFHSDGENIYLIATDFLASGKVPASKNGTALGIGTNSSQPNGVVITNAVNDSNYSAASNAIASDNPARPWLTYLSTSGITPSTSNKNMKAVAYLMDQDVWSEYKDSSTTNFAEWAIGGPTLELFRDSYNSYPSHSSKLINTQVYSSAGYKIKWSSDSGYSNYITGLSTTELSNLWIKGGSSGSAYGYWLASPSAGGAIYLMFVTSVGHVESDGCGNDYYGLRPVVCIKSDINITNNGDGTATLSKNSYEVEFNSNGGSGSMANQEISYGTSTNLSSNSFTKTGYAFLGWNTAANGSGVSYKDEQAVTDLGNMTLYAQWQTVALGDTIYYNPSGSYEWLGTYATSYTTSDSNYVASTPLNSSTGNNFNLSTWKVLSVDSSGNIDMVPSAPTTGKVTLHGAQGYNNAVYLLNAACSSLYKDTTRGITARSISMDDIETIIRKVGSYSIPTATRTNAAAGSAYSKYPVIYSQESLNMVNTSNRNLGLSQQTSLIERSAGTSTTNYIGAITTSYSLTKPYHTFYELVSSNMAYGSYFTTAIGGTNYKYSSMLLPNSTSTPNYWVASRAIVSNTVSNNNYAFDVRCVSGGALSGVYLFNSYGYPVAYSYSLFPVVSLSASNLRGDSAHSTNYEVK